MRAKMKRVTKNRKIKSKPGKKILRLLSEGNSLERNIEKRTVESAQLEKIII